MLNIKLLSVSPLSSRRETRRKHTVPEGRRLKVTRVLRDVASIQPSQATVVTYLKVANKVITVNRQKWKKKKKKKNWVNRQSSVPPHWDPLNMNSLKHRAMEQSLIIFFKYFKENGPCYMHWVIYSGVDKTRNMEHPGTSRNMKKLKYFLFKKLNKLNKNINNNNN